MSIPVLQILDANLVMVGYINLHSFLIHSFPVQRDTLTVPGHPVDSGCNSGADDINLLLFFMSTDSPYRHTVSDHPIDSDR